jgi:hypothetical protein
MSVTLYIKRKDSAITEEELLSVKGVVKEQGAPIQTKKPMTGKIMTAFSNNQLFWTFTETKGFIFKKREEIRIPVRYSKRGFICVDCHREDSVDMLRPLAEALNAQIFDEEDNIC